MIVKQPKTNVDEYIDAAPDGSRSGGIKKGKKLQITLTISPDLLQKVDELAVNIGQSRAAIINMAIVQTLQSGLRLDV